ncbi:hypothetical protein HG530_002462 [Fusarium avenaceum]|nr:hypothetical protein HG530_002462 [Fusarium avenaceum]
MGLEVLIYRDKCFGAEVASVAGVVLLDGSKDVLGDVAEPARLGDVQGSKCGDGLLLTGRQNDSQTLHAIVIVSVEILLFEQINEALNNGLGIYTLTVTDQSLLELVEILNLVERGDLPDLVSSTDKSTGTGIRLKGSCELSGGYVSVDIKQTTILRFGHRSENRDVTSFDGFLNRFLVDLCDLSDVLPLLLVETVNKLQVLLEEKLASHSKSLGIGDSDTLFELRLNAGLLQEPAEFVKEEHATAKLIEVFGKNGTADLDNSKLLGLNRGEELEVLLALPLAANAVDSLRNNLPSSIPARRRGQSSRCG